MFGWKSARRLVLLVPAVIAVSMAVLVQDATPVAAAGSAIEPLSSFESEAGCNPTLRPGTKALGELMNSSYPGHTIYYYPGGPGKCEGHNSSHNLGRAIDFMTEGASQEADAQKFITWLLATDADGNTFANARRLGVMYLIHNHKIWKADDGGKWSDYNGSDPHTNHIHISLNNEGANKQTSYWTGAVVTAPPMGSGSADAAAHHTGGFSFNLYQQIAELFQETTAALLWIAMNLIMISPDPSLKAAWYRGEYGIVLQISLWLMVPIIFAATIGALMRGGLQQVVRTYCWALPIGVFGGVVTITMVDLALKIDNEMTKWVFSNTHETIQSFYDSMNKAAQQKDETTGGAASFADSHWSFIQMVLMFFFLFMLLFLVLEMFFRNVMIYMAVLFIPFSLAAYIWGPVRVWFYNLCELVTTMVFAKFVIAAVMSFGFTAMAYATTGNGTYSAANLSVLLGALIVMSIACISGPVLVSYVMSPSHSILSFKAAKQITPWNHDRKFAGSLFKANYGAIKEALSSAG